MAIKLSRLLVILSLVLIGGCYPNGAEFIDDIDLVYTNYSNQFGFSSKQTYAIPDSVIKIRAIFSMILMVITNLLF